MAQQSSVQEADHRQREHVGEDEEAAVEEATDSESGVRVDIDVDAERARLSGEAVVDDVVLRDQRTVGERYDHPHQYDHDDGVALSSQRA